MNRSAPDLDRERLPPLRELLDQGSPQTSYWGWILRDPRVPELQYFVPYPTICYGSPAVPAQPTIASIPPISDRTLPPLTTASPNVFYYPAPLEKFPNEHESRRLPRAPSPTLPSHHHSLPPYHPHTNRSSSVTPTRAPGPAPTTPSSSFNSDLPASMSSSPEEVQPTPGTSPQELYYEQTRPEPSSPSPAPTRPTHLSRHAPTIPARAPTIRIVQFLDVTAHTAKCDDCDRRNREGMIRCCICGWQCCRNCQNSRGGSRTHRSFQSIHVASQAEADEADQNVAANALVRMNKGPATTPSSRTTRSPLLQRARDASIDGNRESDETVSVSEDSADDLGLWKFGGGRRNPPRGARPEGYAD